MRATCLLAARAVAVLLLALTALPIGVGAAAQIEVEEDEGLQPDWLEDALNDYWEEQFDAAGREYEAPEVELYGGAIETDCGDAERGTTPFFCPADGTIYIAGTRYDAVVDDLGEPYWVVEVANLWGTAVIWQLDLSEEPEDEPAGGAADDPFLHWCLGGSFVAYGVDEDYLSTRDVDDAFEALEDREFDEDAIEALETGYDEGLDGCDLDLAGETGEVGIVEDGLYVSPLYGYTITYDPDEWEVLQEDQDPDNEYDSIFFVRDDLYIIGVTGDPDYDEDEMTDCVEDYVAGFELEPSNSDVEPLDERDAEGDEDGRAWATYTYTYEFEDGEEEDYTRYYECYWLGDGVTIVILHDTPIDDYEDEIEAREEFIEGIEPADGGADANDDEEEDRDRDRDDRDEDDDDDTV